MIIKIQGEQPFQVLSTNFTISASESGYDLYFSADGRDYSKLFTVAANTNRQVTQVAAGSYYFLSGNTDTVTVNWIANCYSGGEGGGGSYVLPVASSDTLGGVKIGSGLTMSGDTLNANPGGYTLPAATDSTLGGVKVGSGLTIDANGVLSVSGGTGGDMTVLKSVSELPNSADTGDVVAAAIKVGTDWVYVGEGYYDTNISSGNPYGAKYVVLGTYADTNNNTVYFGIVWENGQWKFVYDMSAPDYGEYVSVLAENSDSVTIETYTGSFDIYFSENDGVYTFDVNNDSEDVTRVAEVVTNPMVFQFNGTSWDKVGDYTLPAASQNTLGGIKVGSGLAIDSGGTLSVSGKQDTLSAGNGIDISGTTVSVNIGDGLAFSGNTIVVSGNTGGGQVFYIDNIYGTYLDLATLLFSYWDDVNSVISSAYPADDIHIYMWLGQDFQGAFEAPSKGYVELFPDSVYEEDNLKTMKLTGVYVNDNDAYIFKYGLCEDGSSRGNWTEPVFNFEFSRYISYCRFGNDGRGYLTYDADNDRFEYDSAYVATGDTSNACPDLVDWLLTKQGLIDGGLIFDYICVQNLNKFFVTESGVTSTYTHPAIGFKELASTYTIGDYTFGYEVTYKYTDWVLKIDMAESNNVGANLRITRA